MSAEPKTSILIIDDDSEIRYSLERVLGANGYQVESASSGEEGIECAEKSQPPVVFLDNRMQGITGIETLQHLRSASPHSMVILMTAFGTTQTAIEAMKFGAFDYIIKPFDIKKVLSLVTKAIKAHNDLASARETRYSPILNSDDYKEGIVGSSEPMQEVFKIIGQVAASDVTVMITGESGTGKELVARCIYRHSHRANRHFVAVNCAAIPENLIESELFGHEKGSFTGATQQRMGKFELCDGGTLFLDEIGDMALPTQTKILRALQEGEIQRVGGNETIKVDVRLIAATNKDLEKMVEEKQFREDLYYRLNVMRIRMPGLRERREDVPALVDFMLQRLSKERRVEVRRVSDDAMRALTAYNWPGNVRELENVVQRSAVVAKGDTVLTKDLPREIAAFASTAPTDAGAAAEAKPGAADAPDDAVESAEPAAPLPMESGAPVIGAAAPAPSLGDTFDQLYKQLRDDIDEGLLQAIEREMIIRALAETGGNQVKTSALLGMTRATLRKRIQQLDLRL
ncbi:MAG: sigma-54-dependent Fis family transcriptional regulator [Opitutales bacterium]|nr:sigma-54-dependent Fis family transcriptional regulator [Opitutales bacterium]